MMSVDTQSFTHTSPKDRFIEHLPSGGTKNRSIVAIAMRKDGKEHSHRKLIGYMLFEIEDDHVYLAEIAVRKKWRSLGAGRKMIRWLMKKLPEYKRTQIKLFALNEDAGRLYRRLGFKGDSSMTFDLPIAACDTATTAESPESTSADPQTPPDGTTSAA